MARLRARSRPEARRAQRTAPGRTPIGAWQHRRWADQHPERRSGREPRQEQAVPLRWAMLGGTSFDGSRDRIGLKIYISLKLVAYESDQE
jgi:hypothetical protein